MKFLLNAILATNILFSVYTSIQIPISNIKTKPPSLISNIPPLAFSKNLTEQVDNCFELSEVNLHTTFENRTWSIFQNNVFDFTDFIYQHPGGKTLILQSAGTFVEPFWEKPEFIFHTTSSWTTVKGILQTLYIGPLCKNTVMKPIQPKPTPPVTTQPKPPYTGPVISQPSPPTSPPPTTNTSIPAPVPSATSNQIRPAISTTAIVLVSILPLLTVITFFV